MNARRVSCATAGVSVLAVGCVLDDYLRVDILLEGVTKLSVESEAISIPRPRPEPICDLGPAYALLARHRTGPYPYRCKFGLAELEIDEDVFCPSFTQTSSLLLDVMSIEPGDRVLDVFAGSGALGINAALRGATAVTVDISASAVICARKNAKLNSVEERTDVRWGDLHSCLNGSEKFDVVVANPPLLPGPQPDSLSMAVFDPNLRSTVDFVHGVGEYLHDASTCYLLTSSVIEFSGISLEDEIHASGLTSRVVKSSNFGYETYRVREIRLI